MARKNKFLFKLWKLEFCSFFSRSSNKIVTKSTGPVQNRNIPPRLPHKQPPAPKTPQNRGCTGIWHCFDLGSS